MDPLDFPAPASNLFRGALGTVLHRTDLELYRNVFAPAQILGPTGLRQPPRPFVLRCCHLDEQHCLAGAPFHIDLHLLMPSAPVLSAMLTAFRQLARDGIGPRRSRLNLESVHVLGLHGDRPAEYSHTTQPLSLDLSPTHTPARQVRIEFLTPTELKSQGEISASPSFDLLFRRVLSRLTTLKKLYSSQPLSADPERLLNEAQRVETLEFSLDHVTLSRTSKLRGRTHPLGGFVGHVEYRGHFQCLLPFLAAARWTGVGRQTVWGKGEIATTITNPV